MSNQTETIKSISQTGEYNGFYQFRTEMESGMCCEYSEKSNPPKFVSVGDEVNVEIKWTVKGGPNKGLNAVNLSKAGGATRSGGWNGRRPNHSGVDQKDTRGVEVGAAIKKAIDVMCATTLKEHALNPDTFRTELKAIAQDILSVGEELRNS